MFAIKIWELEQFRIRTTPARHFGASAFWATVLGEAKEHIQ